MHTSYRRHCSECSPPPVVAIDFQCCNSPLLVVERLWLTERRWSRGSKRRGKIRDYQRWLHSHVYQFLVPGLCWPDRGGNHSCHYTLFPNKLQDTWQETKRGIGIAVSSRPVLLEFIYCFVSSSNHRELYRGNCVL